METTKADTFPGGETPSANEITERIPSLADAYKTWENIDKQPKKPLPAVPELETSWPEENYSDPTETLPLGTRSPFSTTGKMQTSFASELKGVIAYEEETPPQKQDPAKKRPPQIIGGTKKPQMPTKPSSSAVGGERRGRVIDPINRTAAQLQVTYGPNGEIVGAEYLDKGGNPLPKYMEQQGASGATILKAASPEARGTHTLAEGERVIKIPNLQQKPSPKPANRPPMLVGANTKIAKLPEQSPNLQRQEKHVSDRATLLLEALRQGGIQVNQENGEQLFAALIGKNILSLEKAQEILDIQYLKEKLRELRAQIQEYLQGEKSASNQEKMQKLINKFFSEMEKKFGIGPANGDFEIIHSEALDEGMDRKAIQSIFGKEIHFALCRRLNDKSTFFIAYEESVSK